MYTKPTAPRSIGGVLDSAFSLWWPALKATWVLTLIPQVARSVLTLLRFLIPGVGVGFASSPRATAGFAIIGLVSVVVVLAALGFYNALWARVDDAANRGSMTLGQSLTIGFSRWGPCFAIGFLLGVAVIPLVIAMLMFRGASGAAGVLSGPALFAFVYVIFLLFLSGRLFLAFAITIIEDLGPLDSLGASWNLTRGHFWRCAAILTVITIVVYLMLILVVVAVGAAGYRSLATGRSADLTVIVVTLAMGLVNSLLLSPLVIGTVLSIYYDLKMRKEGADLAGRIEALDPGQH